MEPFIHDVHYFLHLGALPIISLHQSESKKIGHWSINLPRLLLVGLPTCHISTLKDFNYFVFLYFL